MCWHFEAVCWSRCTVFFVHRKQMALPLTPPCVFLSPSWTTAWRDPYLDIVGGGEGKALKARLCGDAIRQTAVGLQSPHNPAPPVQYPLLPFFCCSKTRDAFGTIWGTLGVVWATEAPGQALGIMRAVSRRVLPIPQSQVTSSDKTLTETQGIRCKFSTLDRKINRDYLQRQYDPSGSPLFYPLHGGHR